MGQRNQKQWKTAKQAATTILQDRAGSRVNFTICYSDLCTAIDQDCGIRFEPHEPALGVFLGEISTSEYRAGRGMLTAIVVHKSGDHKPGAGFYDCADALGLDVSDIDRLWVDQLNFVHDYWRKQNGSRVP